MERLTTRHSGVAVIKDKKCPRAAMEKLARYEDLEELGMLQELPCKMGDTVYDVVFTGEEYIVARMKVGNIVPHGSILNGKLWNCYLEDDYTYAYRTFNDFGKTVFLNEEEAKKERQKLQGDIIEVGDIVRLTKTNENAVVIYAGVKEDVYKLMYVDHDVSTHRRNSLEKTGVHFDIKPLLKELEQDK